MPTSKGEGREWEKGRGWEGRLASHAIFSCTLFTRHFQRFTLRAVCGKSSRKCHRTGDSYEYVPGDRKIAHYFISIASSGKTLREIQQVRMSQRETATLCAINRRFYYIILRLMLVDNESQFECTQYNYKWLSPVCKKHAACTLIVHFLIKHTDIC